MEDLTSTETAFTPYILFIALWFIYSQGLLKLDDRAPPLTFSPTLSSVITPTNDASPSPQAANTKL